MPLHESKLNLPPRLVISSVRIDKTEELETARRVAEASAHHLEGKRTPV